MARSWRRSRTEDMSTRSYVHWRYLQCPERLGWREIDDLLVFHYFFNMGEKCFFGHGMLHAVTDSATRNAVLGRVALIIIHAIDPIERIGSRTAINTV